MQKNLSNKTLAQILNTKWTGDIPTDEDSSVNRHLYYLYNTPIYRYGIEDIRFIIGQEILLEVFVPIALDILYDNILAEGDFYEGDLLYYVLTINPTYWANNSCQLIKFIGLLLKYQETINSYDVPRSLKRSYDEFIKKWGNASDWELL